VTDDSLAALRREHARLAQQLAEPLGATQRAELKAAIVALFRRSEQAIADLSEFKDSIRALVEGFKTLPDLPPGQSVRYDHIGASTHIERGWTALAGGEWRHAEVELRDALRLDPGSSVAESLLGWALLHQDRGDEALQRCLQVLVREPEQGLARAAIGAICLRKGITGEAIEHLSRAVRATDPRATLYANYWLGVAYLERDMLGDAIEVLELAVRQGPNLAEGWTELGRARWLRGDHPGALVAWQTGAAVRHSPFAAAARVLLETAESGGSVPRSPLG
jgi:predicted Zn-dependent protease